jgi:hypothetical protein
MKNRPASPAALIARIKSLRHRHKAISDKISTEETRPMPDTTLIKTLKKQRLLVKDAIFYTGTILTRAGIRSHG